MKNLNMVKLALSLSILNLIITVAHIAHDVIEFSNIRFHIDQAHPGADK